VLQTDPTVCTRVGRLLSNIGSGAYELTWLDYQTDRVAARSLLVKSVPQNGMRPIIVMGTQRDKNVDREAIRSGASNYLLKGKIDCSFTNNVLAAVDNATIVF
jgi:diguanylate cyclase